VWRHSLLVDARPGAAGSLAHELLPALEANYRDWVRTHYHTGARCMFQSCHADGQENSATLDGCRPTINAVMFAEATAIAAAAAAAGNATLSAHFEEEAARWRGVVLERLWSEDLSFFTTLAQPPPKSLHDEIKWYRRKDSPTKGNSQSVQTYFGCLACPRGRACPPERGWPVGKLVPVRELSALTSPWYFGAVPAAPAGRSRKFATAWSQLQDPKGFLHR